VVSKEDFLHRSFYDGNLKFLPAVPGLLAIFGGATNKY
jgi:hypothetical protein